MNSSDLQIGCSSWPAIVNERHFRRRSAHVERDQVPLARQLAEVGGGERPGGTASTVLNLAVDPPAVLREGPIDASEVLAALGASGESA